MILPLYVFERQATGNRSTLNPKDKGRVKLPEAGQGGTSCAPALHDSAVKREIYTIAQSNIHVHYGTDRLLDRLTQFETTLPSTLQRHHIHAFSERFRVGLIQTEVSV
jgi:hypothetical protein